MHAYAYFVYNKIVNGDIRTLEWKTYFIMAWLWLEINYNINFFTAKNSFFCAARCQIHIIFHCFDWQICIKSYYIRKRIVYLIFCIIFCAFLSKVERILHLLSTLLIFIVYKLKVKSDTMFILKEKWQLAHFLSN